MKMLDSFEVCSEQEILKLPSNMIARFIRGTSGTPDDCAYLDVDTSHIISRITIWSSGHCDREILSVQAEKSILREYNFISDSAELISLLQDFVSQVVHAELQETSQHLDFKE